MEIAHFRQQRLGANLALATKRTRFCMTFRVHEDVVGVRFVCLVRMLKIVCCVFVVSLVAEEIVFLSIVSKRFFLIL